MTSAATGVSGSRSRMQPSLLLLHIGYVFVGFATVLLGPILPFLAEHWSLGDGRVGIFFTAQFVGSTVGAVLSSYHPRRSLTLGYGILAAGLLLLACNEYALAIAATLLYGVGLGLSLTATNIVIGLAAVLQRSSKARALARVNVCWGMGAVLCPELVAAAASRGHLRVFVLLLALAAGAVALLLAAGLARNLPHTAPDEAPVFPAPTLLPPRAGFFLFFAIAMFLYVGAENSLGGWLAMLALRTQYHRAMLLTLSSLFWFALLIGRIFTTFLAPRLAEVRFTLAAALFSLVGTGMLIFSRSSAQASAGAVIAGLGLAPVFPLLLAMFLGAAAHSKHTGLVFAFCGFGGAVLPGITGQVSARFHSLRLAFSVPAVAVLLIFIMVSLRYISVRRPSPGK